MSELIVTLPEANSVEAFTNTEQFDALLRRIREVVESHQPDVSTDKGRKAIASLAYKVAKTKTALDAQGKALTDGWRQQTKLVDQSRKRIRDELDALKDEARRPLTEWERAEESRQKAHEETLSLIKSLVRFDDVPTPEQVRARQTELKTASKRDWEEYAQQAELLIVSITDQLGAQLEAAQVREAERAELEALRAKQAEAERLEAERIAKERAEALERERKEAEARAAEEQARREAEAAERARVEAEQAAERRIAQEKARADAEIAKAKAEAERQERERLAEEQRQRDEEARRAADLEHRKSVNVAARDAISEITGLSKGKAEALVAAIVSGGIPSVSIKY